MKKMKSKMEKKMEVGVGVPRVAVGVAVIREVEGVGAPQVMVPQVAVGVAVAQVVGVAILQMMVGVGVPRQMAVEVGVLQVAVSWVVGLPQVVVRVALP